MGNHVVIKNGVIGLSSHIGLFCIDCSDIHFFNLKVRHFESHGIAMHQFRGFSIKNVEIGPSVNGQLAVNNNYKAARFMLPIFYAVAKQNDDEQTVYFHERGPYTMQEIVQRLIERMDLAFEYAVNGMDDIDESSEEWIEAKKLFIDADGVSEYGTVYGLVLKPKESSADDSESAVAVIEDLYIHDLIVNPRQIVKIGTSQDFWLRNSFNAAMDLSIDDSEQPNNISDAIYYGDVYSDALIAVRQLSQSWWSLQRMIIWPEFIKWSQGGKPLSTYFEDNDVEIKRFCGYDMVSGSSEGVIGISVEHSYNIQLTNVRIDNLINMAPFGISDCEYEDELYYQANHARAINIYNADAVNVQQLNVSNILSFSGPSYGIYVDQRVQSDVPPSINLNYAQFSHIDAGIKAIYDDIDLSADVGSNWAASSCSVWCEDDRCDDVTYYGIEEQCMNGHKYCSHLKQMMIHNECVQDATYTTPIGTLLVSKNGEIEAELLSLSGLKDGNTTPFVFRGEYFALAIIIILAILMAIKCIYFKSKNDSFKRQRALSLAPNEESALMSEDYDNEQIDYDAII